MRFLAARPSRWTTGLTIAGFLLGLTLIAAPAAAVGSWTSQAVFPLAGLVRSCGVYFPDNGKFYAMGGRTSDTAGSDLTHPSEYDPISNSWTTKAATFSDGQVNNMACGVLDFGGTDYIVAVGGSAAGQTVASAEVRQYDPVTDVMTTLSGDTWPGTLGTVLPGGAAVFANKLYVFGGFNINVGMIDQIWRFDPGAAVGARWTQMTSVLPAQRGYVPVAASGAFIYGFGGPSWDGTTLVDSNTSWRFDPTGDGITTVAVIPRATGETRAVRELDGRIWVLGGGRTTPNPGSEVDIYDPVGDSWSLGPALLTARRNFPADIDPATGEIYTAGGYAPSTASTVNEKYSAVVFRDGFETGDMSLWSLNVP